MDKLREKGYQYIGHHTNLKNLKGILKSGKVMTAYERWKNEVDARGIYSYIDINFEDPFTLSPDFSGVYCHLVHDLKDIELNKNEIVLLFPLDILLQKNWHFNVCDRNGYFYPDTYTRETLDDIPDIKIIKNFYKEKGVRYVGNEVIFHDGIPINNCMKVYDGTIKDSTEFGINYMLELDLDRPGCFTNYSDWFYSGLDYPFMNNIASDKHYLEWMRKYLPEKYKYLCDECNGSRVKLASMISNMVEEGEDLFTYLYINRGTK